jgi:hypothetical protein
MAAAGIRNKEHYYRKMVLDGYIIRLDLADIREMTRMLANTANNLNQIAKRVNTDGSFFASDINDLNEKFNGLWEQTRKILLSLANIKR